MQKKVLVIDNDNAILDVMVEALNYEGFEVTAVTGTENIIALVNEARPDVVIIDYLLDGINGGELCHQIKSSEKNGGLPVIIFSAYPRVLQSLGDYGCNAFIPKPFDLSLLVGQINNFTKTAADFYN